MVTGQMVVDFPFFAFLVMCWEAKERSRTLP